MTRKRIIVIAAAIFAVLAISVAALLNKKSPEPLAATAQQAPSTAPEETPGEQTPEPPVEETGHDDEGEQYAESELSQMKRNAESATSAYLTQIADESKVDRRNRLEPYFVDGSNLPSSKLPVSEVYTVSLVVIESEFTKASKPTNIALRVYVKANINTGFDAYSENQTWIVELVKDQGVWLTSSIKQSTLPYIKAQS